ncbi:hypothetical protein PNEG_03455 [Pneumocystis murina B123]|uniref:Glucose-induced degradation protein 4 n=1 Tax=Pneumocystis murina (strain B123) TaxID=1069680 RepID=M7NHH8_PNEMU|nr:hypothetical protein PNEG_03455 [Pneumocystis murina B123]EMR08013.1 hypothetical protein PNEG_03455 [Pneumocystis murina B123]
MNYLNKFSDQVQLMERAEDNKVVKERISMKNISQVQPSFEKELSKMRLLTLQTSFLRSGAYFIGTQQSGKALYEVSVNFQHVNPKDSFLCGYLHIQGLTKDNSSLTTYFEGEIIGPKYGFITKRPEWGSTEKIDLQHWIRFQAFRPFAKNIKKPDFKCKYELFKDHVFMRWKEMYIVSKNDNEQVSDYGIALNGISYAGFYYICFQQSMGNISGIYYHKNSEQFQQLTLQHDGNRTFSKFEFR